jgi:hypothetical protein
MAKKKVFSKFVQEKIRERAAKQRGSKGQPHEFGIPAKASNQILTKIFGKDSVDRKTSG